MIRENVKMNMDIISAFAEGKTIQYKTVTGSWCDLTENEGLPMLTLEAEPNNFRIKPEPKYRPFKDAEECWNEMLKHQPFGWTKINSNDFNIITTLNTCVCLNDISISYIDAFDNYTFADETPFGVKVEG